MTPDRVTDWIHSHPRLRALDRTAYRLATAAEYGTDHADPIGITLIVLGLSLRLYTPLDAVGLVMLVVGAVLFGVFGEYGTSPFAEDDSA